LIFGKSSTFQGATNKVTIGNAGKRARPLPRPAPRHQARRPVATWSPLACAYRTWLLMHSGVNVGNWSALVDDLERI